MSLLIFAYTFRQSQKRYDNFEFGKFDLGNMSQVAWNSTHGRLFTLTDQFGSNISRVGMSHVDWILVLLAPFYRIYPNPMMLVFIQNIFLASAVIPIYLLINKKTGKPWAAFLNGLIYLLYPANAYLLIWSEYHGVTHVAPLLIWIFWYLEKHEFHLKTFYEYVIFWLLYMVMLSGKEQIGFMLGIFGLFIFWKQRKSAVFFNNLGLYAFLAGTIYSLWCFLILIPSYQEARQQSIRTFLEFIDEGDKFSEQATGSENFFLNRYKYLGNSYEEISLNLIKKPNLLVDKALDEDKTSNLRYLAEPFGYLSLLSPIWLISLPDLGIGLLADVKGFLSVENQRSVFISMSMFLSFIYVISFIDKSRLGSKYRLIYAILIICLGLTIKSSVDAKSPLFTYAYSLIKNKLISKVFSAEEKNYTPGQSVSSRLPETSVDCQKMVISQINKYNPEKYSGPNAFGAQAANREVNALFPTALPNVDLFVTDLFEEKAYKALREVDPFPSNILAVQKTLNTKRFEHVLSCGRYSIFVEGAKPNSTTEAQGSILKTNLTNKDGKSILFDLMKIPDFENSQYEAVYKVYGESSDKLTYWKFINEKGETKLAFLDYKYWIDMPKGTEKTYHFNFEFIKSILKGKYKVIYGFGDTGKTTEAYIFDIKL